ncbi:unnamed protein product [Linum trigynum]|uniref:RNase H type-1 domain-containing protein n=1 Tax=Linum trigynum TaxID=586398 RepID=A0AAV2FEG4_9ROSI
MEEEEIIHRALGWLSFFLAGHETPGPYSLAGPVFACTVQDCRWAPPPEGVFKLNSDAGVIQDWGIGLGCIIRDSRGNFVGAMAKKERGVCRPIEAESKALVLGLREANRRLLSPLIVETDCQVLVNLLKKGEEDFTDLSLWCYELKEMAKVNEDFLGCEVMWEFRPRRPTL